jgi:hypothetical protein
MGLVEGISITISQHNGGTPSFEQLWASDSESPKLDIYYREAISDLEKALSHYVVTSTAMFDLQALGSDYVLQLKLADTWSDKLTGVLKNKIQDYLVHVVTAGWLNDFDGVTVKQDYQAMSAQDIEDIKYLCCQKTFSFTEHQRTGDSASDTDNESVASSRKQETEKSSSDVQIEAGARGSDDNKAEENATAESRVEDTSKSKNTTIAAGARTVETAKATPKEKVISRSSDSNKNIQKEVEAGARGFDNNKTEENTTAESRVEDTDKASNGVQQTVGGSRHEDNSPIDLRKDWTDWGGIHGLFLNKFKR